MIRAGEYKLRADMTGYELIDVLRRGRVMRHSITFVEGWRFVEILAEIGRHTGLQKTLDGLTAGEVMVKLGRPGEGAEGWFFPDTYFYHKGVTDLSVLSVAMERMSDTLSSEWHARSADAQVSDIRETLILASIVEKETGLAGDRKLVASVFTNRLKMNGRNSARGETTAVR